MADLVSISNKPKVENVDELLKELIEE